MSRSMRHSCPRSGPSPEVQMPTRPPPSSDLARQRMESQARRDTRAELAVRRAVWRRGLRYRVDVAPLRGSRRRADLVFTRARVAVFIDGCFWHSCPIHSSAPKSNTEWWADKLASNVRRDRDTDAVLEASG